MLLETQSSKVFFQSFVVHLEEGYCTHSPIAKIMVLFSELFVRSHGKLASEFQKILPKEDKMPRWLSMLSEWQNNMRYQQSFVKWSKIIEEKYDVKSKLSGFEELKNVSGFECVDDILFHEVYTRIADTDDGLIKNAKSLKKLSEIRAT